MVKAVLAGLLILALGAMWTNRDWLRDAYRTDEPAASIRLSGVDLAFEPTPIEATPYRVPAAPDTRAITRVAPFDAGLPLAAPAPSLSGGDATFTGIVTGPDGPVAGAIVRLERHTDHGTISLDTTTDEDGGWVVGPLAGGRYRVRAWLPDLMTMGRSEVRFVADDEVASFEFALWGVDPAPAFEFVDGGPMYDGVPAVVAVVLGWKSIDADGLVVTNPLPGAEVTIETTAQVEVSNRQPIVTNGDGVALVRLRCVPTAVAPLETQSQPPPVQPAVASQPGLGGSLTARSGLTSATFVLPGCLPNPGLVVPDPDTQPDHDHDPGPDPDPEPGDEVEPGAGPAEPADGAVTRPSAGGSGVSPGIGSDTSSTAGTSGTTRATDG